ncbi:MAG TPA: hypothetical protein VN613_10130, partial [Gemmatimonadaceae bacterium]|nr:hypothetical protein [Gemmatimonadaceae bacterium]
MPYIIGMDPTGITSNLLGKFTAVTTSKSGTLKLLEVINKAQGRTLVKPTVLLAAFESFWPQLETSIKTIPPL